jgi:hypothetical protein
MLLLLLLLVAAAFHADPPALDAQPTLRASAGLCWCS